MNPINDIVCSLLETPFHRWKDEDKKDILNEGRPTVNLKISTRKEMKNGKSYNINFKSSWFGAPAFMSMPHFYMADPSYAEAVVGMVPDPSKHNFYLALEPNTGLPLKVHASLQVSLYLERIEGISMFQNVTTTMMPVLWFRQHAAITENLADLAKTLIILPNIGSYTAYGIIGIGGLLLLIGSFITVRQGWKGTEDEEPLTQNHL